MVREQNINIHFRLFVRVISDLGRILLEARDWIVETSMILNLHIVSSLETPETSFIKNDFFVYPDKLKQCGKSRPNPQTQENKIRNFSLFSTFYPSHSIDGMEVFLEPYQGESCQHTYV